MLPPSLNSSGDRPFAGVARARGARASTAALGRTLTLAVGGRPDPDEGIQRAGLIVEAQFLEGRLVRRRAAVDANRPGLILQEESPNPRLGGRGARRSRGRRLRDGEGRHEKDGRGDSCEGREA